MVVLVLRLMAETGRFGFKSLTVAWVYRRLAWLRLEAYTFLVLTNNLTIHRVHVEQNPARARLSRHNAVSRVGRLRLQADKVGSASCVGMPRDADLFTEAYLLRCAC